MKRVLLFIATNLAIMLVLGVVLNIVYSVMGIQDQGSMQGIFVLAAVFGMGGAFISLAISKWMALRATGAEIIKSPRNASEVWLLDIVSRQAQTAGIGMPEVAVYDSPDPNAFATGMNKDKALVAVSTGLLQRMNKDEVEAVLGHEISHIANGDMVTLTLIQGVLNTFVIFLARIIGGIVDQFFRRDGEGGGGFGYFIAVMLAQLVLGMLASLIVLWFSRQREFRADAGGAHLAGSNKMIAALKRLGEASTQKADLPSELTAFGIHDGKSFTRLFMSHPPLEERIRRLQQGSVIR